MPEPASASLLHIAMEAADRAGELLRTRAPGSITMKSDRNPATETDFEIENDVRVFLRSAAPNVAFLGEESGRHGDGQATLTWALDPVDGTVNFLHGLPLCGVSLALIDQGTPTVGVVTLPFLHKTYIATQGGGAYCGNRLMQVGQTSSSLRDAVIALGDFAVGTDAEHKNAERLEVTKRLISQAQRVRLLGSAAIDLVWVAEGLLAASVTLSNKPWDMAAGVLIAREAGALVVDRWGKPHTAESASTIAAHPTVMREILELLR